MASHDLARPTNAHGQSFRSQLEADFYGVLMLRQRAKEVRNVEREITYKLDVNGVHICAYIVDFKYEEYDRTYKIWKPVYVDTKGDIRPGPMAMFNIKKRLMLAVLDIDVEVWVRAPWSRDIVPLKRKIPSRKLATGRKLPAGRKVGG